MRVTVLSVALRLLLPVTLCAVQVQVVHDHIEPDVNETILQERYHIASTEDGLIEALRHPEANVRTFAAVKLAEDAQSGAILAILAALASETFPGARINMAIAAARLGAEDGVKALKHMCKDPTVLGMAAASAMLVVGKEDCRREVLDVLAHNDDDQTIIQALYLLPRFEHLTATEIREVQTALPVLLRRNRLAVRQIACAVLFQTGGVFALQALHNALPSEQDEALRNEMAKDLQVLERRLLGRFP